MRFALYLTALVCAGMGHAQPLFVYSEFAQIDAKGKVIAPEEPREILSPALARNAFTSFQLVVQVDDSKDWWLHLGQNPENAVRPTIYREMGGDKLERVDFPVHGKGTQVFWMDLWTERVAPIERIKVEPQLNIDDDWVIYPMEARVMNATVPGNARPAAAPTGSLNPYRAMRRYVCEEEGPTGDGGISIPGMRFRNAQQDIALAGKAPRAELQKRIGDCTAPLPANPEAYFPLRDYLFQLK